MGLGHNKDHLSELYQSSKHMNDSVLSMAALKSEQNFEQMRLIEQKGQEELVGQCLRDIRAHRLFVEMES